MDKICIIVIACMTVISNCAKAMMKPTQEIPTVMQIYFSLSVEEQEDLPDEVKAIVADMSVP